ncbi:hypothetical protein EON68_03670 [archaeon]|nr:MAG: hypothetical protein EON68_03670 [archaeon]
MGPAHVTLEHCDVHDVRWRPTRFRTAPASGSASASGGDGAEEAVVEACALSLEFVVTDCYGQLHFFRHAPPDAAHEEDVNKPREQCLATARYHQYLTYDYAELVRDDANRYAHTRASARRARCAPPDTRAHIRERARIAITAECAMRRPCDRRTPSSIRNP